MNLERNALIDAFEDLLDRERELVLSGSFDRLTRLAEEKAQLAARLGRSGVSKGLEGLQLKAERNGRLLQSAGAGLRSVACRIAAMRNEPEPLLTYSENGRRTSIGEAGYSLQRRA